MQVRLQEIPSGSSFKNSAKNSENLLLVLDISISTKMKDLTMTFTSRLKMDAKCTISREIESVGRTILGHPK